MCEINETNSCVLTLYLSSVKRIIFTQTNCFLGLLTALFRGTDLIPSDVMAGLILLRVQQKRETHELRQRSFLLLPKYTSSMYI